MPVKIPEGGRGNCGVAGEELGEVGGLGESEVGRDGCCRGVRVDEETFGFEDETVGENLFGGLACGFLAGAGESACRVAEVPGIVANIVAVAEVGFQRGPKSNVYLRQLAFTGVGVGFVVESDERVEQGGHQSPGGLVAGEELLLIPECVNQRLGRSRGRLIEVAV